MNKLKFQLVFVISLLILLSISYSVYLSYKNFQSYSIWVNHSENLRAEIENLNRVPIELSNEVIRAALTGDQLDTIRVAKLKQSLPEIHSRIDSLVLDNKNQKAMLDEIITMIDTYIHEANVLMVLMLRSEKITPPIIKQVRRQEKLVDEISVQVNEMKQEENELLKERISKRQNSQKWTPLSLLGMTMISLIIIIFLFINIFSLYRRNVNANNALQIKVEELKSEIGQREQLEVLLRSVLNSTANGIVALEPVFDLKSTEVIDFIAETTNTKSAELFNKNQSEIKGRSFKESFPEAFTTRLFPVLVEVATNDNKYHDLISIADEGQEKWIEIEAIKNGHGVVATFTDITLKKNYELEIVEKQKELEITNLELEQFAYIASHDLKEPLRKIRTFGDRLSVLISGEGNEKALDFIARMQNAAFRMQVLIDDLLRFSRISRSENMDIDIDLNDILAEAVENLETEIEQKEAVIKSDKLPVVRGIRVQLVQLFQNLLSNSLKYAQQNVKPRIDISSSSMRKKYKDGTLIKNVWKISFKDNGIGFEPVYKEKVFEIFQRLHARTAYEGTGIGLAICEKIVLNHGGSIESDSKPNEGATFDVYLPKNSQT